VADAAGSPRGARARRVAELPFRRRRAGAPAASGAFRARTQAVAARRGAADRERGLVCKGPQASPYRAIPE
jgi:hypothetical protein